MAKKGGSAPAAPDPRETAAAESQYNRLDTYSPSGSGVRHGYTAPDGTFTQGVAPEGQQSAQKYIENPFETQIREALEPASVDLTNRVIADNITGMPEAPRAQDRSDVATDLFSRSFSLMAPAIDRSNSRLLTNLQARGLPVGGEAFNEAYGDQQRQTQDTISRLAMDANLNAGQEQTRQYGLDQASRSNAIAELVAAMGGGYNPPNAVPTGNAQPINYSGMVSEKYNADLNAYNQRQSQAMGTAGALGSLGGALLKSTRTAKDVEGYVSPRDAALMVQSIPVSAWRYKGGQAPLGDHGGLHIGPMAEDFQAMTGVGRSDRIDAIDYLGLLMAALQDALRRIGELEAIVDGEDPGEGEILAERVH